MEALDFSLCMAYGLVYGPPYTGIWRRSTSAVCIWAYIEADIWRRSTSAFMHMGLYIHVS